MPPRKITPVGTLFDRLTVIGDGGFVPSGSSSLRSSVSHCKCVCGSEVTVRNADLNSGHTTSCGCRRKAVAAARSTTHGQSGVGKATREYISWQGILVRTTNPNRKDWMDYGGRGIKVCDRWLNSFENFYEDMGAKPSPKHSLDRINNDGDYCKENCRWATRDEQSNNKRSSVRFTFYGLNKTVAEWSVVTLVPTNTIRGRLLRGWSSRFAVWAPVGSNLEELQLQYPHHASHTPNTESPAC